MSTFYIKNPRSQELKNNEKERNGSHSFSIQNNTGKGKLKGYKERKI
jgi:hypothetical protein